MVTPVFRNPKVEARFDEYPHTMRQHLFALRALIFAAADEIEGVGPIEETLKWHEPAYLNPCGTTIRINAYKGSDSQYGLYVHCQTDLIQRYQQLYGDVLRFEGNRGILFQCDEDLPVDAIRHCIAMALTYHRK